PRATSHPEPLLLIQTSALASAPCAAGEHRPTSGSWPKCISAGACGCGGLAAPPTVGAVTSGEEIHAIRSARLGRYSTIFRPAWQRPRRSLRWGTFPCAPVAHRDRKSTRLNSSHLVISYAVFCLKKKITF